MENGLKGKGNCGWFCRALATVSKAVSFVSPLIGGGMDIVLGWIYEDPTPYLLGANDDFSTPKVEAFMNNWFEKTFNPWFTSLAVNFSDSSPSNVNRFNVVMKDLFFAKSYYKTLENKIIPGFNAAQSKEIRNAQAMLLKDSADVITTSFAEVLKRQGSSFDVHEATFKATGYKGQAITNYTWPTNHTVKVNYLKSAVNNGGKVRPSTGITTRPSIGGGVTPIRPSLPTAKGSPTATSKGDGLPYTLPPQNTILPSTRPVVVSPAKESPMEPNYPVNCLVPPCPGEPQTKPSDGFIVPPDPFNTDPATRPMEPTTGTSTEKPQSTTNETVKVVKNTAIAITAGWLFKGLLGI